jgi:hypothetical protein
MRAEPFTNSILSLFWMYSLSGLMRCYYRAFVDGLIAVGAGAMLGPDIAAVGCRS